MTAAEWAILIPAVAGVLGALAAYLKAQSAHAKIDQHTNQEQK
jgi:hypothetical protein